MTTKKHRSLLGARDIVFSMGLILILALVSIAFMWKPTGDPVRTVAYGEVVDQARKAAPFAVTGPEALPATWRATSARIEPQEDGTFAWFVGFVTPDNRFAAVSQRGGWSEGAGKLRDRWIAESTRNGKADATPTWESSATPGLTWRRLVGESTPDEKRALVRTEADVTTVVQGSASWDELQTLAASLRSQ